MITSSAGRNKCFKPIGYRAFCPSIHRIMFNSKKKKTKIRIRWNVFKRNHFMMKKQMPVCLFLKYSKRALKCYSTIRAMAAVARTPLTQNKNPIAAARFSKNKRNRLEIGECNKPHPQEMISLFKLYYYISSVWCRSDFLVKNGRRLRSNARAIALFLNRHTRHMVGWGNRYIQSG